MTGRPGACGRLAATAVAAALALLSGCTSDSSKPDEASNGVLLTASEVGGTEVGEVETLITTASPCLLDGADQWTGADASNANAYRRTVDGATEHVVIAAVERSRSYALDALRSLRQRVATPRCSDGESDPPGDTWTAELLPGLGPDTVGFRSVVSTAPGAAASDDDAEAAGRHSYLRAYRYVDGHMVMVWLERVGDSDPSVADLRQLLDEQSEALAQPA